ncbi:MAG TPA: rhomboid family intramembrane serine protease [Paludibacter sp.]|nr:rhomboid family intramembrane serine protease [Paludibacter sp.]
MLNNPKTFNEKRQFINAVFIPFVLGILMIMSFLLEKGMGWDFHTAGIFPRRIMTIGGIFTLIFVHVDWSHLANNVISFVLLGSSLYFFYKEIASKVLFISYISSGLLLWLIGRDSWHVGASGLIYSIAFFLFFSGIIRKHVPLIALSLVVAFIYGNMVWHVFPWKIQDPISWEGHLAGGLTGIFLSVFYRKEGPQRPVIPWTEEEDEEGDEAEDYMEDAEEENQSNTNNYI